MLNSRRKAVVPTKESVALLADIQPLNIEDLIIVINNRDKLHFKRLKYKGCPTLLGHTSDFPSSVVLIDMNRDSFIRDCYQKMQNGANRTIGGYFEYLIKYLKWLDEAEIVIVNGDLLDQRIIDNYMAWCLQQVSLAGMKRGEASKRKVTISWLLKQHGRFIDAKRLPSIKGVKDEVKSCCSLDLNTELKAIAKELFRAYRVLLKHLDEGTIPERHPLYNESLINTEAKVKGWTKLELGQNCSAFKHAMRNTHIYNHITRIAMMITFMFTGMNFTPLSKLKLKDISLREVRSGVFILESVKGRANYQEQDNALGFSKYAKEFIESWIRVSTKMANGRNSGYLFPFYNRQNEAVSYINSHSKPQSSVNCLIKRLGLPKINSSIFRKTKSDTIFRVTESVYLVALSNNNSIEVTGRTYVNGTNKEHENNLSASLSAKYEIAKGQKIEPAVQDAKFKFADILDDYDYQRLRIGKDRTHESRTPTGVRCNDNRRGASKIIDKALKRVGVELEESEIICTDFLSCFNCQEHALVTDVDDIWLMLSFRDTLQQLQQIPAINSMPERKYIDLVNMIEAVVIGYQRKNPSNFKQAKEKLKDSAHPLYAHVYSLNDLLEVFA
jgi:hypothetical protein